MHVIQIILLSAIQAWAHGEDRPGPHGGFISMPGAFHVELVVKNDQSVMAYLLDMNWMNPTSKDSSIQITHSTTIAKCRVLSDHFKCDFPATVNLSKTGELKVQAKRENQQGNSVTYSLPLKIQSKN